MKTSWLIGLGASILVAVLGLGVIGGMWSTRSQPAPQQAPAAAPAPTSATPPPTTTASTPTPVQLEAPSTPREDTAVMVDLSRRFVTAWLIREPRERGERLRPLCTDELLEGLVNTRPDKIVRWTPSGEPQLVMADASGGMVRQAFTNGRVIELRIVPNPQTGAPVVASVRPAE